MAPSTDQTWKVFAAAAPGARHRAMGVGSDDAHAYKALPGGLMIVVADGAGSARRGGDGARLAIETAMQYWEEFFQQDREPSVESLASVVVQCRQRIKAAADGEGLDLREFATTLLAVAVCHASLYALQIGDGAIVAEYEDGLTVLTVQQPREYVNEITFLTSTDFQDFLHLHVGNSEGLRGLAIFSDGVEDVSIIRSKNEAHPGFFSPLLSFARSEQASVEEVLNLLTSEKMTKLVDDDVTLVLAVR